jgi:phosphoribosylformylglycinamidine (FGAM) synthase PurS component
MDEEQAKAPDMAARLRQMADELLANPVIEDYEVKV